MVIVKKIDMFPLGIALVYVRVTMYSILSRGIGTMGYEYFFPMDDKETVLLIDSWKDQHSIDVHHVSPMMAKITELREKYGLHMRVERYVSIVMFFCFGIMEYIFFVMK